MGRIANFILSVTPGQGPAAAAVAREQADGKARKQQARAEQDRKDRVRRHRAEVAKTSAKNRKAANRDIRGR